MGGVSKQTVTLAGDGSNSSYFRHELHHKQTLPFREVLWHVTELVREVCLVQLDMSYHHYSGARYPPCNSFILTLRKVKQLAFLL
jgi:hypothetical protein